MCHQSCFHLPLVGGTGLFVGCGFVYLGCYSKWRGKKNEDKEYGVSIDLAKSVTEEKCLPSELPIQRVRMDLLQHVLLAGCPRCQE